MLRACWRLGAAVALLSGLALVPTSSASTPYPVTPYQPGAGTATPIQHVVVVFQENVSFDHYFGTYPNAANASGEPAFRARPGTPTPNNYISHPALLTSNPNTDASTHAVANPQRLDRSQALTCDQDHDYTDEQQAFDGGAMDKFTQPSGGGGVDVGSCSTPHAYMTPDLVMDYYDGNTVTGMWNLAQHFALNDNSFGTVFGPSTPGALNLVGGQTNGVTLTDVGAPCTTPGSSPTSSCSASGNYANGTVIGDPDPLGDDCSNPNRTQVQLADSRGSAHPDTNIGDALSAAHLSWGWFEGGFRPTAVNNGTAVCGSRHFNIAGNSSADYSPHHEPFQYFPTTLNQHHLSPSSPQQIGQDDPAGTPGSQRVNHQYGLADFYTALQDHNLPAVSFLKASEYQDGHAGYSDPLDEQTFLADLLDTLQRSPEWSSTAVVIAYDDSDGWYDHVFHSPVNTSQDPTNDALTGAPPSGQCGAPSAGNPLGGLEDRCGPGPRMPLLVVSPWARQNFIDHTFTDQTSILKFVEENWGLDPLGGNAFESLSGLSGGVEGPMGTGDLRAMFDFNPAHERARPVLLDDQTGQVTSPPPQEPQGPPGAPEQDAQGGQQGPQGDAARGPRRTPGAQGPTGPAGPPGPHGATPHVVCSVKAIARRIRVSCVETGAVSRTRSRARVRLSDGHRVVAAGAGRLGAIRLRGRARHGVYLLTVTVTVAGAATDRQVVVL